MTKFFKNKSKKAIEAPVPRSMEEIQKENAELNGKAAQAQYLVYIYGKQLKQLNEALESTNNEAAARIKLDNEAAEAAKSAQKEEVK